MDIKEIKTKPAKELDLLLKELRKKLDDLKFKAHQGQLKNVKEVGALKKDIARILTVLSLNKKDSEDKSDKK